MKEEKEEKENPTIKHLVIAGGGTYGFQVYGFLQELRAKGFWKRENLVSCYATSIGTLVAIMLILPYSEKDMTDYFIGRPWHHLFEYNINKILSSFQENGIFDKKVFIQALDPLLKGVDLHPDITLQEFYEFTKIDFHFYTTNINQYGSVDVSHTTHPHWKLVDITYASCCLPFFFKPLQHEEDFYIDGGIFMNYPLEHALKECKEDEILGVRKIIEQPENMNEKTSMLDCMQILLHNTIQYMDKRPTMKIPYEIAITSPAVTMNDIFRFAESEKYRREWFELGKELAKTCWEKWNVENIEEEEKEITLEQTE